MQDVTKQTLAIYWNHSVKYKKSLIAVMTGCIITAGIDVYKPLIYGELFNTITSVAVNRQLDEALFNSVFWLIVTLISLASIHQLIWRAVDFVNSFFQARVMSDLMNTCYDYLLEHSNSFFNNSFVGSLTNRLKKYSFAFETIADQVCFELGRTALLSSMLLVAVMIRSVKYGFIFLAWMAVFFAVTYVLARIKLKHDIKLAYHDDSVTGRISDSMANNVNIKLFDSHKFESEQFHAMTDKLFRLRRYSWNLGSLSNGAQGIMMVVLEGTVIGLLVFDVYSGKVEIGELSIIQLYILKLMEKSWQVGRQIRTTYQALADANEMTNMLMLPHEVVDAENADPIQVSNGQVCFKDVQFAYNDGRKILGSFNMNINSGESVALVGVSGGGKSTLMSLLLRLVDIQNGAITIDGQNISEFAQGSLRRQIGFVPQEPILFHRSLMENIRYGRQNATDDEVIVAAKAAHCHEFIQLCNQGYETLVGERGVKLSGGERQRIAIARAFLKDAPILVLDEATSSLDPHSEILIQDSLRRLMSGRTTVVIAHRLSTIKMVDRIMVIENGHVVEQGSHQELLTISNGRYLELWNIQVGGFILPEAATA